MYAFGLGSGIGFDKCFGNGFTISPSVADGYSNITTEPTNAVKTELWNDFGESYEDFKNNLPPVMFGMGLSIGWSSKCIHPAGRVADGVILSLLTDKSSISGSTLQGVRQDDSGTTETVQSIELLTLQERQ